MAVAMTQARAASPNVTIPGGVLDGSIAGVDVYVGVPNEAAAPPGKACQAVKRYVDLVNAGQFAKVADLFQENAALLEPTGHTALGRDQIRAFYEKTIGQMRPQVVAVAFVGDDTDCMVELATKRKVNNELRYVLVSVDHFKMGADGRISSMIAFVRPPRNA